MAKAVKPTWVPGQGTNINDYSAADIGGSSTPDFQLGNANNDQFQSSWGTNNRPNEIAASITSNNTVRNGQRTGPTAVRADELPLPTGDWRSGGSAPIPSRTITGVQGSQMPRALPSANRPLDRLPTDQGPTSLDSKGIARFSDPNLTQRDRLGRALTGAVKGVDTGSTLGNLGVNAVASATGLGLANRAAGAAQGYTSKAPVSRKWGGTPEREAPPPARVPPGETSENEDIFPRRVYDQNGSGSYADPSWENEDQLVPSFYTQTEEEAPREALKQALGSRTPSTAGGLFGGFAPSMLGDPGMGVPGESEDPYVTYPEDPNHGGPKPTLPGFEGRGPTSPIPKVPTGGGPLASSGTGGTPPVAGPAPGQGPVAPPPGDQETAAGQEALAAILSGGQQYQTDGSQGRLGTAGAGGGNYSYAGFDFGQDPSNRDIGKSAKYAFSHLAGQAANKGVPQPRSKEEAEQWFAANIKPGMDALGFTVHKVQGDKAFISAPEHPEGAWVDFQGNSGGQGDQPLTWQAEMGTSAEQNPEDIFAVQDWGGGGSSDGGSPMGMDRGAAPGVLDSGNKPLNGFADTLVQQLLEQSALQDATGQESRNQGITPAGLRAVGF